MKLTQKAFFTTREFEILHNGVQWSQKRLFSYLDGFIDFDDLSDKTRNQKDIKKGWLIASIIFLFSTFLSIVGIFTSSSENIGNSIDNIVFTTPLFLVCFFLLIFTSENEIFITGNENLGLFRNKPSLDEVDNFVKQIIEQRRQYIIKNATDFDENDSIEDKKSSLKYLLKEKIISEIEYNDLLDKFTDSSKVGF